MADEFDQFDIKSSKSETYWRSRYDRAVVPEQRKILEKLTVGTLEEKIGKELATAIGEKRKIEPDSKFLTQVLAVAQRYSPEARVFLTELETSTRERLIVIDHGKNPQEKVTYLEIFVVPEENKYWPGFGGLHNKLTYKHDLILDTQTGLVADLTDLFPKGVMAHLDFSPDLPGVLKKTIDKNREKNRHE